MRVLVFGGRGRIGRWNVRLCESLGDTVTVCDEGDDMVALVAAGVDVAILAVPLPIAAALAVELCFLVPAETLLIDLSSVKAEVFEPLSRAPQSVALVHQMCGAPAAGDIGGKPLVRTYERVVVGPLSEWYERYVHAYGGAVTWMSVAEHDRAAEVLQAAVHSFLLAFAEGALASGVPYETYRAIAPPVAAGIMQAAACHFGNGSDDIFVWLQAASAKHGAESAVAQVAQSIAQTAEQSRHDLPGLRARWHRARDFLFGPKPKES